METITIDKDTRTMYVPATSFPDGVMEAHKKLHSLVPASGNRKYLGISRPENGVICYKAATEEIKEGEAQQLNLDTLVLRRGNYASITINNFMQNLPAIGNAFQQLLSHADIDPNGYCVEWYFNETDIKCMVRLNN